MRIAKLFSEKSVWSILAMSWMLAGCEIYSGATPGDNNRLSFYEPNRYPADKTFDAQGFELPLALGARADVWVLGPAIDSLNSVEVEDPQIVDMTYIWYPIELFAKSEGRTRLHVTTQRSSDSLSVTVTRPDGVRLWVIPTSSFLFGPEGYSGTGYALRPGARLRVAAQPLAERKPLLGFDLFEWSIEAGLFSHRADGSYVNTRVVEALGNSGVATLSTQLGGELELATLSADDPVSLEIYSLVQNRDNPVTELIEEDTRLFLLVATDLAGRHVVPSTNDFRDFEASITEGTVILLEARIGGRLVELRACPGHGMLSISYLGARLSVPIEVPSQLAAEECP